MPLARTISWLSKNGLSALAAGAIALILTWCAAVSPDGSNDATEHEADHCSVVAGHGGSSTPHRQGECPAILDAEGSVDEVELRDPPPRVAAAKAGPHAADVRFPGRDHPDVALEQSALVANAADLGRLCRRLI